ncbi:polysaccharide biosynthesis/export family protein [Wenyingzhuangia marina]|uniref:Polysaccharide export outer membrane protein n=1 Tax=Wenyingzhuangia marina TaxID=1195760 RepID=A0A1M5WE24_9FLAO|nr:polysaccharide biosynthesis/export family protein [Wenyingzhuangia marina]GGF81729.1 polysaccharide export outer membrane protein [Wenyingzhuangia marina]SHH85473.1 polysaccharide export outer membrane protein [Wenyingzhuangia marina]
MKGLKIIIISLLALGTLSCASRKDIIYLQDVKDKTAQSDVLEIDSVYFKAPTIKPDDRLTINISSINPEAARPFNLYLSAFNTGGISATGQQQQQSYLVDADGYISFPQLGDLKVIGFTRVQLEKHLEKKIKPFLPDVKANVQLVNFRVSILGEVKTPGEYSINRDKISVLQALAMAGDLTIHGKREDIKLIRENKGKLTYYNIDLRSKDIVTAPFFYLQQNDVIYVAPNKPQVNASASSPTASYIISATGLLITIISILTR